MPTRRRFTAARSSRPIRRRRSWSREVHSQSFTGAAAPLLQDLLTDFRSIQGINAGPPGMTIGGVRGSIDLLGTTASGAGALDKVYRWGLIVATQDIEAVDLDWSSSGFAKHLEWLDLGQLLWNQGAASPNMLVRIQVSTRAMRKLEEVGDTLFLWHFGSAASGDIVAQIQLSTLLILP